MPCPRCKQEWRSNELLSCRSLLAAGPRGGVMGQPSQVLAKDPCQSGLPGLTGSSQCTSRGQLKVAINHMAESAAESSKST